METGFKAKKGCCYQCQKRVPGCHSWCQRYAVFREEREQIRKENNESVKIGMYIQDAVAASKRGKR